MDQWKLHGARASLASSSRCWDPGSISASWLSSTGSRAPRQRRREKPLHVLTLDRQEFVDFIHRDPDAATLIMAELARRLRHTNELVSAATEDMQRLGGMEALDAPYNRVSIREMI